MCDISCPAGWFCPTTTSTNSTIITTTTIASITNLTNSTSENTVAKLEQFKGKNFYFFNTLVIINLNLIIPKLASLLINYWPMSNLSDVVGGANLYGGSNYSFASDRFGSPNSAIYFNKGYLQVPEGVYFSGDFTVSVWIYLKSYQPWWRIFDFGNGEAIDNVVLAMFDLTHKLRANIYKSSSYQLIDTSLKINLNEWYFMSFVLNGTAGYIYVNGNQVATGTLNVPNNITRKNNYIGKSNWGAPNADAIYDEFKIYQVALSSTDIMNEYQISLNNGKLYNK
jgi:hypothetical protein